MKKIESNLAPKAIWPYSQAVIIWNTLYSSWQIALNPKTMTLVEWWIISQTKQVCKNLWEVLKQWNMSYENVVKTTVFLDDINDFSEVNKVYSEYFSHCPARSTVEVSKLPLWALIEIEVIAINEIHYNEIN